MEMIEEKEPRFRSEWKDGDTESGVLYEIKPVRIEDRETRQKRVVSKITLLEGELIDDQFHPTGERVSFLGTHQINEKLFMMHAGHYVSVRYEGRDPSVQRNGNQMRKFKIMRSAEKPLIGGRAIPIAPSSQSGEPEDAIDPELGF